MKNTLKFIVMAVIFILLLIFSFYTRNSVAQKDQKEVVKTDQEICYGTWSLFEEQVKSCWKLIKEAWSRYAWYENDIKLNEERIKANKDLMKQQAEQASWARAKIKEVTKKFYDENLSWTNVDF